VNMKEKAVRSGDWKLIIDGAVTRTFLFNVKADPGERQDWFAPRQDIAQRVQKLLTEWQREESRDGAGSCGQPRVTGMWSSWVARTSSGSSSEPDWLTSCGGVRSRSSLNARE